MAYDNTNPQRLPLNNTKVALTSPTLPTSKDFIKPLRAQKKEIYRKTQIYQIK
jgi:hypothetical protein